MIFRVLLNNSPLATSNLTLGWCVWTLWRPVWPVRTSQPTSDPSQVEVKRRRDDILATIWSNNSARAGSVGPSVQAVLSHCNGIWSVDGTNTLSSTANTANHREITRRPGGYSLYEFCLQKKTAEHSGQRYDWRSKGSKGRELNYGSSHQNWSCKNGEQKFQGGFEADKVSCFTIWSTKNEQR